MGRYGDKGVKIINANEISEIDLVWLAAVIDCEGTVSLRKCDRKRGGITYYGRCFYPWIEISNNDIRLLEKVLKITGVGKIIKDSRPPQPRHWTPSFSWRLYQMFPMKQVAEQVLPYLIVKRDNMEILLSYLRLRLRNLELNSGPGYGKIPTYTREEEQLADNLRLLNRKGTFISKKRKEEHIGNG